VQDVFKASAEELRATSQATLPAVFGPTVSEPAA